MASFQFNVAKGRSAELARLPGANDALIAVLLQGAGLEADAALKDHDTLAAVLAAANNEATFTGYTRATLANVAVAVNDTTDTQAVDFDDPSWAPTTAETLGKIIVCYDPDTTAGTDADLVPLWADDYVITTPTSGTISYTVADGGMFAAA